MLLLQSRRFLTRRITYQPIKMLQKNVIWNEDWNNEKKAKISSKPNQIAIHLQINIQKIFRSFPTASMYVYVRVLHFYLPFVRIPTNTCYRMLYHLSHKQKPFLMNIYISYLVSFLLLLSIRLSRSSWERNKWKLSYSLLQWMLEWNIFNWTTQPAITMSLCWNQKHN